jgi:hypothetical protein
VTLQEATAAVADLGNKYCTLTEDASPGDRGLAWNLYLAACSNYNQILKEGDASATG